MRTLVIACVVSSGILLPRLSVGEDYSFALYVKSMTCDKVSKSEKDQDEIYLAVTAGKNITRTGAFAMKNDYAKKRIKVWDTAIGDGGGGIEIIFHVREAEGDKVDIDWEKLRINAKIGGKDKNIGDIRLNFMRTGKKFSSKWKVNDTNLASYTSYRGNNVVIFSGDDSIYTVILEPVMIVDGKEVTATITD